MSNTYLVKRSSNYFFLKRTLEHSSRETKLFAYTTLVRPVLEYALIAWFPHTQTNVNILESVQRKAIRFVHHKYGRFDSPTESLKRSSLLTIADRAKLGRLKFVYLLLNDAFKMDKNKYVNFSQARTTRHKHCNTLTEYSFNNNTFRYSFFPSAVRDWNSLDPLFFSYTNVDAFIQALEQDLLSKFIS